MWSTILELIEHTKYDSPHFLVAIFALNALGEAGIPFPLIMQGLLLFVGYSLSQGRVSAALLLLVAALLGSWTGASSVYWLSRLLGKRLLEGLWNSIRLKRSWLAKAEGRLASSGTLRIAMARLTPGLILPVSVTLGTVRVPWFRFAAGVGLSELVWAGSFVTVGFVAGSTPYDLGPFLVYFPGVVVAVVVLMVLLKLGQWAWRARRARSGSRGKAE